jgi:hypothetical protein
MDEWCQLLSALFVRNREEVLRGVGEIFETALKVTLPPRARVDVRLWRQVFFVFVETLRPIGRSGTGGGARNRGVWRGWDVGAIKGQGGIRRERGNGRRWSNEVFDLICSWRNH